MKKNLTLIFLTIFSVAFSQKKWSLQECVDYAIKNNLQIISTQYNTEIQSKNADIAKRDALPGISGNINNTTNFGNTIGFQGSIGRNDYFSNSASLGANVTLYNHGRIRKNAERSQYELDASLLDLEKTKNDISLQIAQLYLQVLLNREVKKIADESLANAEKVLKRAKATTDAGTTPKTVEAEARAGFAREKQRQKNAEIDIQRSLFNLAVLLQLKDYQTFDVQEVSTPDDLQSPLATSENIVEKAFENQPQIKAAQARILSAQKQTEVAKTQYYPTITGNLGLGTNYFDSFSLPTEKLVNQYRENLSEQVSLSANITIFNKGITRLRVEQAKISENIAKNTAEIQKQEVRQNVQRAYFDANAQYEVYQAALEAEKSARLALDFAEKSFEAGRSTIYDLTVARNNFVNAQGTVSQAKYNYLFSNKLLNFYAGIPIAL